MSRRRKYNQRTLDVIERFFHAIDVLVSEKTLRGLQTYCRLYGIDKRHFYAQRQDMSRGYFEISWILPLIEKHGISANWILFGKGDMRS